MKIIYATAILTSIILFTGIAMPLDALADVISPKKQLSLNVMKAKVSCKQGFFKVIKTSDDSPACVKLDSVSKLVEKGWAKAVDTKLVTEAMQKEKKPLGEIKNTLTVRQVGDSGRLDTTPLTVGYNFIFDVCAFDKTIRAPQAKITSDSETKIVKLIGPMQANTCQTSAVKIKAKDPASIMGTLTNQGGVTDKITSLENKIVDLKAKLDAAKKNAGTAAGQATSETDETFTTEVNSINNIRKELNAAKNEYNTYLFSLFAPQKSLSQFREPLKFEGSDIEGVTFEVIRYQKQINSVEAPFGYNVYFNTCAPGQDLRLPQVKVTSDTETVVVKLAEKVLANTCQPTMAKIKADKPSQLSFEISTSSKVASKIPQLEADIDKLGKDLAAAKEALSQLTRTTEKPADYEQQVTSLTDQIADLRNKINANRAQLAQYQFQFYQ